MKKSKPKRFPQGLSDSETILSKETLREVTKYQEAFLFICQQKEPDPNSKLLSFVEIIEQLRKFSEKQARNPHLANADQTFWGRIDTLINSQALPDKHILNEKSDAAKKGRFAG